MAEKRYTEYIIHGIIDGLMDAKPTRPDIALLKQRLHELSAIEKERLTKIFDGDKFDVGYCTEYGIGYNDGIDFAIDKLSVLSSAQSEIIRCKDCKWFQCNMRMDGYLPKGVDEFECRHWCGSCDPDDYCSYGERKES